MVWGVVREPDRKLLMLRKWEIISQHCRLLVPVMI
jgi:hypothetical protein